MVASASAVHACPLHYHCVLTSSPGATPYRAVALSAASSALPVDPGSGGGVAAGQKCKLEPQSLLWRFNLFKWKWHSFRYFSRSCKLQNATAVPKTFKVGTRLVRLLHQSADDADPPPVAARPGRPPPAPTTRP
jgi:hypothetical protein